MDLINRISATTTALKTWTISSLVANIVIIVTGAVVRLTDSGLGCPTWPHCSDGSYVPKGALSHHKLIEFGNRTLTFVLLLLAVMVVVAAYRTGASVLVKKLVIIVAAGIPFQAVVGGIAVRSGLNPFVVAVHLLLSIALVVLCVKIAFLVFERHPIEVSRPARVLSFTTFVMMMIACWLGTVVTGSGPNSGDHGAARTGFDIETVSRLHSISVWFTVAATIACLVVLRRARSEAWVWAAILLGIELVQGTIGYAQYYLGLPIGLVIGHMLGVGLSAAAAAALLFGLKRG